MNAEFYRALVADPQNMLEHMGVIGMKWGIRRYQNPDGTLTRLGKARLADGRTQAAIEKWEQKKGSAIAKGDKKFVEKHLDYMTNEDIAKFNDRIRARNTINGLKQQARTIDAEKIKTWANTASNITMNAANVAQNMSNLYNTVAKLHNAFGKGPKWKLIGEGEEKPRPETIKRFFDEDGDKTQTIRTYTDKDGNTITDTRKYGKPGSDKTDKGDAAGDNKPKDPTPPKSPSGGSDNSSNPDGTRLSYEKRPFEYRNVWKRENEKAQRSSKEPEHVQGEVVDDGHYRQQHESRHDRSTVDAAWRDVTPSGALTTYQSYKALLPAPSSGSKKESNSSKSNDYKYTKVEDGKYIYPESVQKTWDSSSNSGSSGGFKGFKNNWTESAAKGYQDIDDYTEELLRKGR